MVKVIFFGTPDYVLPILEALHKYYKVVAVVTQPPKEVDRKKIRTFSAVDNWAHKRNIQVITNLDVSEFPEANLGVVAAFGRIIPQNIINYFNYGILNIHPSILPKYRGASPIQSQIADGITETGVSVIKMDTKMDHGPIVSVQRGEIKDNDTNEILRNRLFANSAKFLIELLPNYLSGKINLKEQDESQATFTKIISRDDAYISPDLLKQEPELIERKLRAYNPWPGIFTYVNIEDKKVRLKILKAHLEDSKLVLDKVQLEGKRAVDFEEFKRGYPQIEI